VCTALKLKKKDHPFKHGMRYDLGAVQFVSSYHCSRYNTNTGVLTEAMFDAVVKEAKIAAMPAI
jgi:uracil-DNA glycosylase